MTWTIARLVAIAIAVLAWRHASTPALQAVTSRIQA